MMRATKYLVLGALSCASQIGPAAASNFDWVPVPFSAFPPRTMVPPKAYQKPATFLVTTLKDPAEVAVVCRQLGLTILVLGCETNPTDGGLPHVYISNPCPDAVREYTANVLCHEQGHAPPNLWPGNHPTEGPKP